MNYRFFSALIMAAVVFSWPASTALGQVNNSPQGVPQGAEGPPEGGMYPQGPPPSNQMAPPELTLPAGTLITVRLTDMLSSDRNKAGDTFGTVLDQPLVAQGWVVARRGQVVEGRVAVAQNAGRVKGVSQLAVELSELVLVDGQQVPVRTQLVQSSAGTSQGRDVAGVGAATGIGAAIGAAAGGGEGAAIGAAAGAAAGIAGVLSTRGQPSVLYPETMLTFRLEAPVVVSTQQGSVAFQPVTQQDYDQRGPVRNPPRYRVVESYPPPYYYSYSPYYYPPPGFYYGFGYYGFGPRFYVGPRVFIGRGFGRGFHRRR
jgi:hypothetical protein